MATYGQKVIKYAKDLRADERALKGIEPEAYGRIGMYKPIFNILINSAGELNLSPQTIVNAVNRGPRAVGKYISEHKEYIREQVATVKNLKGQMDRRFYRLLTLIDKYEGKIEKQGKKIEKQDKKIDGLEAKLKKDAKKVQKARSLISKNKRLDGFVKAIRDYDTSGSEPMPNKRDLDYLRNW